MEKKFKMPIKLLINLISNFQSNINCLKSDDFCFRNENTICTGKYDA